MPPTSLLHKQNPRAAFITYLPRGSAVVSPLCTREETAPFYPCTVPEAVTTGHLTTWGESGTEPHNPTARGPTVSKTEAKKARAVRRTVTAAAQRQALRIQAVPRQRHTPPTFLSKNGLPCRVRHLLAARERCCFPASHRGGNSPLLLLYRPGSRSLRASDDSERKRDGTPHPYCGAYECF